MNVSPGTRCTELTTAHDDVREAGANVPRRHLHAGLAGCTLGRCGDASQCLRRRIIDCLNEGAKFQGDILILVLQVSQPVLAQKGREDVNLTACVSFPGQDCLCCHNLYDICLRNRE